MKKILAVGLCIVLVGCAGLAGQKPDAPERRVKTLGVLPVLIDVETIEYANRDGLVALLEETSRDVDERLIEQLRKKGDYFDVRPVALSSGGTLGAIVEKRTLVAAGGEHYTYTFNPGGITALVDAHLVDAVLVVIINGVKRPEKRWSEYGTRLEYLETDYRSLLYSAAVVAAPAEVLWRRPVPTGDFFLRLEYPDFMEAYWNLAETVRLKERTLPGLQRALAEPEEGLFVKSAVSKKYGQMVRELVDHLKKGM